MSANNDQEKLHHQQREHLLDRISKVSFFEPKPLAEPASVTKARATIAEWEAKKKAARKKAIGEWDARVSKAREHVMFASVPALSVDFVSALENAYRKLHDDD